MTGTSTLTRIGKAALAATLIATVGVSMPALSGQTETENLPRAVALKLARPLNDRGDTQIGNMPVLSGNTYARR